MSSFPVLVRTSSPAGETRFSLGDALVDSYLEFVDGQGKGWKADACANRAGELNLSDSGPTQS
jgi:hypothetical protein